MITKKIFESDFSTALREELEKRDLTVKDLSEMTGIPLSTLYKITLGDRDPRLSTVRKIVEALEPRKKKVIAIIGAKFLLDSLEIQETEYNGIVYSIKGYSAHSLEEIIVAAIRAERDGVSGLICAPIIASIIEKIVDIPVGLIRPDSSVVGEAITSVVKKIR